MPPEPTKLSYATPPQRNYFHNRQPIRVGSLMVVVLFMAGPVLFFLLALGFVLLLLQ
jgi:hypothetical protein